MAVSSHQLIELTREIAEKEAFRYARPNHHLLCPQIVGLNISIGILWVPINTIMAVDRFSQAEDRLITPKDVIFPWRISLVTFKKEFWKSNPTVKVILIKFMKKLQMIGSEFQILLQYPPRWCLGYPQLEPDPFRARILVCRSVRLRCLSHPLDIFRGSHCRGARPWMEYGSESPKILVNVCKHWSADCNRPWQVPNRPQGSWGVTGRFSV